MTKKTTPNPELAFLLEQQHILDRKINRLQGGFESAPGVNEAKGLTALLQAENQARDLLTNLIKRYVDQKPLSLEAIILEQIEENQRAANRTQRRWQRGKPSPQEFWDAEIRRTFLKDLLQHYHDYQDGRSIYTVTDDAQAGLRKEAKFTLPWYPDVEAAPATQPQHPRRKHSETLKSTITKALDSRGYDDHHLTVVAESDGFVLVTGYAHSTTGREDIIQTILNVEGVREVLACILVNAPEHCLVCKAQRLHLPAS